MIVFWLRVLFALIAGFTLAYVGPAMLISFLVWDLEPWKIPISDWPVKARGFYLIFGSIASIGFYFCMRENWGRLYE